MFSHAFILIFLFQLISTNTAHAMGFGGNPTNPGSDTVDETEPENTPTNCAEDNGGDRSQVEPTEDGNTL